MEDLRYLQLSMAEHLFEEKKYTSAAHSLSDLLESEPDNVAVRLLLARAYYHSAQLGRAEEQLTELVDRAPTDDYVRLLLARTLERQGRGAEAATQRRILAALTGDDSHLASTPENNSHLAQTREPVAEAPYEAPSGHTRGEGSPEAPDAGPGTAS